MSGKPVPIDLVPYQDLIGDSREFLRVWAKEGGPVTCFINPVPVGGDPAGFGVALVDCIRHGAKTWARATGISEAEALARIWEGVDAERNNPTDIITEIPTTQKDGLIH
ncbi:DUF5076 domain-containing protein [Sphingorhabdus contaminans]|uniref:DUF5076 domain-containing protein n=1 Tax=Sphingorhabdus contaminans TaxID=1343899 RepID=UPI003D2D7BA5